MSVRSRVLVAVALIAVAVVVSATHRDYARPSRHFLRSALRALH